MKIKYDPEVDILMIQLSDRGPKSGIEVVDGAILHVDEEDNPIELEILDASSRYGLEEVIKYSIDNLIPINQAARTYGYAPAFLRSLALKGKLKAKKEDGHWLTTPAWVEDCLDTIKTIS